MSSSSDGAAADGAQQPDHAGAARALFASWAAARAAGPPPGDAKLSALAAALGGGLESIAAAIDAALGVSPAATRNARVGAIVKGLGGLGARRGSGAPAEPTLGASLAGALADRRSPSVALDAAAARQLALGALALLSSLFTASRVPYCSHALSTFVDSDAGPFELRVLLASADAPVAAAAARLRERELAFQPAEGVVWYAPCCDGPGCATHGPPAAGVVRLLEGPRVRPYCRGEGAGCCERGPCGAPPLPRAELRACAACKKAAYCSVACQRAAWKAHKGECAALAAA